MNQANLALFPAILVRRYKRFLADIRLVDGSVQTIHCPNTGSMKNCILADSPCWYSVSTSKTRKYPQTLELVTTPSGAWAGINTARTNELVAEALLKRRIPELLGYGGCQREQVYGSERSRIDFLLSQHVEDGRLCYLEVKNVTLLDSAPTDLVPKGYFPDAVSDRASKHLRELMQMVSEGHRAVLLFCVQHTGIDSVSPADHIDPAYGVALRLAAQAGVELLAYGAEINPEQGVIELNHPLPVLL